MKLIEPSYEILEQGEGIQGVYKQIELAGRTCYKSEDKITDESAEAFVQRMIDSGHTAMLEHGTVYFYIKREEDGGINPHDPYEIDFDTIFCKYGQHNTDFKTHETFFTTNLRWLVEQYPDDWKNIYNYYARTPDARWPKRHTVRLTTSLHVYKDLTRHRTMSFAIESTRFCNYSKGKFGSELTFIKPCWCDLPNKDLIFKDRLDVDNFVWKDSEHGKELIVDKYSQILLYNLINTETDYLALVAYGWQAQQAAELLPQCIKADVIITGFESDWDHIFNLRSIGTTGKPHPEVERIITPIFNYFKEQKWTKLVEKATESTTN